MDAQATDPGAAADYVASTGKPRRKAPWLPSAFLRLRGYGTEGSPGSNPVGRAQEVPATIYFPTFHGPSWLAATATGHQIGISRWVERSLSMRGAASLSGPTTDGRIRSPPTCSSKWDAVAFGQALSLRVVAVA